METLKIIGTILGVCLPGLSILIGGWFFTNWSVICAEDIARIPKRLIREIYMDGHEKAKIHYRECQKLREVIKTLDLPIDEKRSFMWRIESMEEDSVKAISKLIVQEELENLRKKEKIDENTL